MTYKSVWKPEIDHLWEEYTTKWKIENPGQAPNKTRFELMNVFIREKYENETTEKKEEVEVYRQKMQEKPPTEVNRLFQELVNILFINLICLPTGV
jgi:hypothetical protein